MIGFMILANKAAGKLAYSTENYSKTDKKFSTLVVKIQESEIEPYSTKSLVL